MYVNRDNIPYEVHWCAQWTSMVPYAVRTISISYSHIVAVWPNDNMPDCGVRVWEDPGSNLTTGSCVYHDSHCDIQPWVRAAHPYCSVYRSTQPSTLRGTEKWVSALGLSNNKMAMVDVDGSCHFFLADSQSKSVVLVWGLVATSALSLHSSNEPGELLQRLCHDDSTINIISAITIIIIITMWISHSHGSIRSGYNGNIFWLVGDMVRYVELRSQLSQDHVATYNQHHIISSTSLHGRLTLLPVWLQSVWVSLLLQLKPDLPAVILWDFHWNANISESGQQLSPGSTLRQQQHTHASFYCLLPSWYTHQTAADWP